LNHSVKTTFHFNNLSNPGNKGFTLKNLILAMKTKHLNNLGKSSDTRKSGKSALVNWVVPENIHTYTTGGIRRTWGGSLDWNSEGKGGGALDWNSKGMGGFSGQ